MNINEILNTEFFLPVMCMETFTEVMKPVRVTCVLDGPGADRRDFCTVTGLQDWDVDMPLENFLRNAKVAA